MKRLIDLPQGVGTILATVFAMALTDAIIKLAASGLVLWQIWILRSALVVPVLLLATRGRVVVPGWRWGAARSLALVAQYLCLYAVLPLVDMAQAGAAFYTAPFFILILSALILGHRIRWQSALGLGLGFAGLLMIVRPFGAEFTPLIALPVAAALFYALAAVLTRARCAGVPALILALWLNLACLATGLALALLRPVLPSPDWARFILGPWQNMGPADWGVIAVLSGLILAIGLGLARAYQSPRPDVIAAFDYAYMIFVIFWGFVFFGEVPDAITLLGAGLIVAGGLATLTRQT